MAVDITYEYDGDKLVAVVCDGNRRELSEEEIKDHDPKGQVNDIQTNIRSTIEQIKDSYKGGAIVVDIEATHGGYKNLNNYWYSASGMRKSVASWTKPYGKPYLVEHNSDGTPKGRIQNAKYINTGKDTGYHALEALIGDQEEIEMVIDTRALTVSVGSHAVDNVECSFCGHDLFHNGRTPKRVTLQKAPAKGWLEKAAPGIYGEFGLSNGDLWDYEKSDDGKHTVNCRHLRHAGTPTGEDIYWIMHEQCYDECSRVNVPADHNEATGEFAHIRQILQQADGLDVDTAAKHVAEMLSVIPKGAVDRARFQVASEKDLFIPTTEQEAIRIAKQTGTDAFFERGLYIALTTQYPNDSFEQQAARYWTAGGKFISRPAPRLSTSEALKLQDPKAFGQWLRSESLTREEKAVLDRIYSQCYMRERGLI